MKHRNTNTKQHHEAALSGRPVLNEKVESAITAKQHDQNKKSAQHGRPTEDKRREARIEHTNGSTPRRDM